MKRLLFVTLAMIMLTVPVTLARAQAPVNQPIPQPFGPAPTVVVPAPPPGPSSTIVVPEGSTITVFTQGVQQDYARHAVQGNVRTFDSWTGRMTLQDGTIVTFPQNFAFIQVPEAGQPVKLTYEESARRPKGASPHRPYVASNSPETGKGAMPCVSARCQREFRRWSRSC